jgi:geranylgeranyl reductase family protein
MAQLGHSTCVVEKQDQPGSKTCCTGIVSADCLSMIYPPPEIIQLKACSARVFSPRGSSVRVERAEAQAYVLDRPALDRHLALRAEKSGAQYLFSTVAEDIKRTPDMVNVVLSGEKDKVNLSGRSLVIASGYPSSVTDKAGLGKIAYHALGAQTEVECTGIDEVQVYAGASIAPGFFAWLVPKGGGQAKVGLLCRKNPRPYMEGFLQHLAGEDKIRVCGQPINYGAVPLKPLARTFGHRLIAVGDAAGQVKPTTGGGIYFGMLSAQIAAATLHDALKNDDLSAARLASYQKGWHKLLKKELAIDYWAHRFYRSLTDLQMERIFSIIQRHGIHESILASPDITFDWHSHVILDVIKHGSLQKALAKLKLGNPPAQ